ncbi:unnamed protein product, partial [Sphenostylis stenocarpa]
RKTSTVAYEPGPDISVLLQELIVALQITQIEKEEHNPDYHHMKEHGSCKLNDSDILMKLSGITLTLL